MICVARRHHFARLLFIFAIPQSNSNPAPAIRRTAGAVVVRETLGSIIAKLINQHPMLIVALL
jgi:hypothetical protein